MKDGKVNNWTFKKQPEKLQIFRKRKKKQITQVLYIFLILKSKRKMNIKLKK